MEMFSRFLPQNIFPRIALPLLRHSRTGMVESGSKSSQDKSKVKCLIPIIVQRAANAEQAKQFLCVPGIMVLLLQFLGFRMG
jgi:hypothetical protein